MEIDVQVLIKAPREEVWKVITNIENADKTISGIEKIKVLERPSSGLVGLQWQEIRTLFGKTATEIMWITDVKENEWYKTRAESHGSVYITNLILSELDSHTKLAMKFEGIPQTLGGKLLSATLGIFFKGATKKALSQDLDDIKKAIEKGSASSS